MYDVDKQRDVNRLKREMDEIETRKAMGAALRSRMKWQQVGDRCMADFFKSIRQKNAQAIISELKDNQGRILTTRKDMEQICVDFYQGLYKHKEISEVALEEVLRDLPITFIHSMNEALSKEITEGELGAAARVMAKGKAPGLDGVSLEFYQKIWPNVCIDYYAMLLQRFEEGTLHKGITKRLISLFRRNVTRRT